MMMNDIGGNSSSSSNGGCGSDSSSPDSKLCRDFIRNVCHRGKNCKFIHPENIKIRSDPIFCHDFQQNRCQRPTCKFIHCSREVEEHYKKTGELPDNVYDNEGGRSSSSSSSRASSRSGGDGHGMMRSSNSNSNSNPVSRSNGNSHAMSHGMDNYSNQSEVPVCKDYLKGVCNRPPGACKYRHVSSQNDGGRVSRNNGRSLNGNGSGMSMSGMSAKNGGGLRRRGSDGSYDSGPEIKKIRSNDNSGFNFGMGGGGGQEFNEDFYVGNNIGRGYSALAPPQSHETHHMANTAAIGHGHLHGPPTSMHDNRFSQFQQNPSSAFGSNRNGYGSGGGGQGGESSVAAYLHSAETIKALEDENFMLKRRIEELKTSNEFLLSHNAQLRLNSSLSVSRNSVAVENVQVQPAVGVASVANGVVQTMVSMAQPMGITPSLSVAATQPLSTISTLPTVSLPTVSISQALPIVSIAQHQPQTQAVYPMVTTQGVLPPPPNLS